MKKIYFVVHDFSSLSTGGVNRVVAEISNQLALNPDLDVNILSLAPVDISCYKISKNVKIHTLNMKKHSTTHYKSFFKILWLIQSYLKLIPFYLKEKKSSCWNLTSLPLIILFFLLIKRNNKFINCEHTSPYWREESNLLKNIYKFILNKNGQTISLNSKDHNFYSLIGVNSILLPNGIKFFNKKSSRDKVIIFVGRFAEEKNPLEAIDIFYESNLWTNGYVLNIYGNGELEFNLIKKIKELGIKDNVFLIKNEKDHDIIYKNASCLIMTSKFEGFGMVLIEAMSRGIPCITYNCPNGPVDIVIDGENGFLIENGKKEKFVKILSNLDNNMFDQDQIISTVSKFDIVNIGKKWDEILINMDNG